VEHTWILAAHGDPDEPQTLQQIAVVAVRGLECDEWSVMKMGSLSVNWASYVSVICQLIYDNQIVVYILLLRCIMIR